MRNKFLKTGSLKIVETPFVDSHVVCAQDLPCFKVQDDVIYYCPYDSRYFLEVEKGDILIIDNVFIHNEYVVFVCITNTFEKVAFFFLDEKSVKKFFKTQEEYSAEAEALDCLLKIKV
jgi:hypothetical protein